MAEETEGKKSRRISGELALHVDYFPVLLKFNPPDKLPTYASVIGRMRSLCAGGKSNMSKDNAAVEVAKEVMCKYYHLLPLKGHDDQQHQRCLAQGLQLPDPKMGRECDTDRNEGSETGRQRGATMDQL